MPLKTISRAVLCLSLVALLGACASAPIDYPRTPSVALTDTGDTPLARDSAEWRKQSPDEQRLLSRSPRARMPLAPACPDRPRKSQHRCPVLPDETGQRRPGLFCQADRGCQPRRADRFLLDDIFTTVDDAGLSLLDVHPNIELRIFNPISRKGVESFNYVGNFKLANRRMHNKSFTVDNQVSILGGRNIAVEYFQLETSGEFVDFDMLTSGPIVQEISASFDTYWNHKLAVPFEALLTNKAHKKQEEARRRSPTKTVEVGKLHIRRCHPHRGHETALGRRTGSLPGGCPDDCR